MAYLVAKRIYQDEIITIASSQMEKRAALRKLAEIEDFPGLITEHRDNAEGELWIEVEAMDGDVISDPARFPANFSLNTLVRTGMTSTEAERLLSDEFAQDWLLKRYGKTV